MELLNSREDILNLIPKNSNIIEIGVFKGEFSKKIYTQCVPKELKLVDIFEGRMGSGDKNGENFEFIDLTQHYIILKNYFFQSIEVELMKGLSNKVLPKLSENHFDFIYIDASHEYEDVKNDLKLSFNKIKNGGIISGHDYEINRFPGVVRAVKEFCEDFGQEITYLTQDKLPSFVIKIKK